MNNIEKLNRIKELIIKGHKDIALSKTFKVFGYQYNYYTDVFGDLNLYWFGPHEVIDYLVPLNAESNNSNRPGEKKEKILYVCVHDTASAAPTADALAHAKYVVAGGGGTSWHYSCGDTGIYHHVPDDEVAYHAGDGTKVYEHYDDSGIIATTIKPVIEIIDGFYYLNGQKSKIEAPKLEIIKNEEGKNCLSSGGVVQKVLNDDEDLSKYDLTIKTLHINDFGLKVIIKDGNYFMGPTYFNNSYQYVSNRLGNLYSIGIETMVNKGSNLLLTWHKCAKLCAHLLVQNNLSVSDVVPHHYFSGKPCPYTMRYNKMWDEFIQMVNVEYEMLKLLTDDVTLEFICDDESVNNGIICNDLSCDFITYQVKIKVDDLEEVINLKTKYLSKNNSL